MLSATELCFSQLFLLLLMITVRAKCFEIQFVVKSRHIDIPKIGLKRSATHWHV